MTDTPSIDEVRAHAQAIVDRAKEDTEFSDKLKADPEGTLKEAGFREQAIPDFARELADVQAHAPCGDVTCLITDVCAITVCGLTRR
jgi:hypothetical protein